MMAATAPQPQQIDIRPQAGPQEAFLSTPADIAIYGGAAGSGKTYGELLEPLHYIPTVPGFGATIFRRTTPQITSQGGLWEEAAKIYPLIGASSNRSDLKWVFPPHGNSVKMAHLEYERHVYDYQGAQIPLIEFDELTHFTEFQFWYLLSRNRSVCGVRPYVRATCNPVPDDDPVGGWVTKLIAWWIDQATGFPIQERAGLVRWFVRVNNVLRWADSPEELAEEYPDIPPRSLTFIPAKLTDNPALTSKDPQYRANLMALPYVEMMRLLHGNWKVRPTAGDVFRREWFTRLYDPSLFAEYRWPLKIQVWDTAFKVPVKKKTGGTTDPDFSVCQTWGMNNQGYFKLDRWKGRVEYPALVQAAEGQFLQHRPNVVLVEDKASGQSLIQSLRQSLHRIPVLPINPLPLADKRARAESITPIFQARLCNFPAGAHWMNDYIETMVAFPDDSVHDDDVDCTSMALWYLSVGRVGERKTVYHIADDYAV
jgi:predicted phage terminase large subunit-like protein